MGKIGTDGNDLTDARLFGIYSDAFPLGSFPSADLLSPSIPVAICLQQSHSLQVGDGDGGIVTDALMVAVDAEVVHATGPALLPFAVDRHPGADVAF